ncbi:MAG: RAMP superfamily CRISPR-associated protein [Thiofilum sp.]|uniref:RAMP superfamily CRISPR-associated protein n=1 Tax=Thiofilum sp. TaxID=2212733 RepID=UPI0025D5BFD8|nr:RAMP superfamily CRISPR-associated protein [Thiofilum sp.]MBK8455490.1 hypothetical protein [Thiofilum sp.]
MQELSYTVSFTTPAFLSNAEQQAQWRTPPFKALLRQWWRVAYAADKQFQVNIAEMRREEGSLFGQAHEGDNRKSLVRIRLNHWEKGSLNSIPSSGTVFHEEVGKGGGMNIQTNVYLGYGPINANKNAIEPEKQTADLWLGFPDAHTKKIAQAIQLIAWFGTLGSRSRNGWGSLNVSPQDGILTFKTLSSLSLQGLVRPLHECLQLDWPHAIGSDSKGILVWKTTPQTSWRDAMRELARVKIAFRTAPYFKFPQAKPDGNFHPRHLLAYPVTRHDFIEWKKKNGRLGNHIRFKVVKEGNKYHGLIVHLPCRLPEELAQSLRPRPQELNIWQEVHKVLDDKNKTNLTRLQ